MVRRNRFFTDMWEPGSTFKPVVMALALEHDIVQLDATVGGKKHSVSEMLILKTAPAGS